MRDRESLLRVKDLTKEALDALGLDAATLGGQTATQIEASVLAAIRAAAPAELDTLDEIAAALNDDANLAGTLTALIATKETPDGAQAKVDAARRRSMRGPVFRTAKPARVAVAGLATTDSALYTVPEGRIAILHGMFARNVSGAAATLTANLVPVGGAASADNVLVAAVSIAANTTGQVAPAAILTAGEVLSAKASAAAALNVVARITEVEASEATALGVARGNVAAVGGAGEVAAYTCPAGKRAWPLPFGPQGISPGSAASRSGASATLLQKLKAGTDPSILLNSTAITGVAGFSEPLFGHLNGGDAWVFEVAAAGQTVNVFTMWMEVDA